MKPQQSENNQKMFTCAQSKYSLRMQLKQNKRLSWVFLKPEFTVCGEFTFD